MFVAGISLGDGRAPFKREIERFHTALASLAEIVAFVVLGLTVNLTVITRTDVWLPGVILGAVLAFVSRPFLVGLTLLPARLASNERNFVLFAGLKGAVPILLGIFVLEPPTAEPSARSPDCPATPGSASWSGTASSSRSRRTSGCGPGTTCWCWQTPGCARNSSRRLRARLRGRWHQGRRHQGRP